MRILENSELGLARKFFGEAREEARKTPTYGSKYGAILVQNESVIGRGFGIHAGKTAIEDALSKPDKEKIIGSTLYFTRINENLSIAPTVKPGCTFCSKLALDNRVWGWVLFQDDCFCVYDVEEYHEISIAFEEEKSKFTKP